MQLSFKRRTWDKFTSSNDSNTKIGLIHLKILNLMMVNEIEADTLLDTSADTLVHTMFSKSGQPKQAADPNSPYRCMGNS